MVRTSLVIGAALVLGAKQGDSAPVPGKGGIAVLEAEDFNPVFYVETTPQNANEVPSVYRIADAPDVDIVDCGEYDPLAPGYTAADDVDAQQCSGGKVVNNIVAGESMLYDVEVLDAGVPAHWGARLSAAEGEGGDVQLVYLPAACEVAVPMECGGALPQGAVQLLDDGFVGAAGAGWFTFISLMSQEPLELPEGPGCVQFCSGGGGFILDAILAVAPAANVVPGFVEAEDFAPLGTGLGYLDASFMNKGGNFDRRPDAPAVDMEICTGLPAGNGVDMVCSGDVDVDYLEPGDFLRYTVNAQQSGLYGVNLIAGTGFAEGIHDPAARMFLLEGTCGEVAPVAGCPALDDAPVGSQALEVGTKLGLWYYDFATLDMGEVMLPLGPSCVHLCFLNGGFHVDGFEMVGVDLDPLPVVVEEPLPPTMVEQVVDPVGPVVKPKPNPKPNLKPAVEPVAKPVVEENPVVAKEETTVTEPDTTAEEKGAEDTSPEGGSGGADETMRSASIAVGAVVIGVAVGGLAGVVLVKRSRKRQLSNLMEKSAEADANSESQQATPTNNSPVPMGA
jgi:hypothetical protein